MVFYCRRMVYLKSIMMRISSNHSKTIRQQKQTIKSNYNLMVNIITFYRFVTGNRTRYFQLPVLLTVVIRGGVLMMIDY